MNTIRKTILAPGLLPLLTHSAFAQTPSEPRHSVTSEIQKVTTFGDESATDVSGAPYSAIEIMTYAQIQADGTRELQTTYETHIYRDSQGRRRAVRYVTTSLGTEHHLESIFITDPVAGFLYRVDDEDRRVTRWRWNRDTRTRAPISSESVALDTDSYELNDNALEASASRNRESLGTKIMEGLTVEGLRQTLHLPAGLAENTRDINVEVETWSSQELKVAVFQERVNSATGVDTIRLTNIERGEPASSLFTPPAEYALEDAQPATSVTVALP